MHVFQTAELTIAWMLALAWLLKSLEAWQGLRAVPNLLRPEFDRTPEGEQHVAVIVPARNEALDISACLQSLLRQDYPALRILAVDDRSTDATATIMESLQDPAGRLQVLRIRELPSGWLGKPHAMANAAREALSTFDPEYLLFTDADVVFTSDAVRRSLAHAVATQADHFVLMPTTVTKTAGEGLLLSFLQVVSLWPVRLWRVADPGVRDAVGVGAFNMIRTETYLRLGGFEAAPMEVLEDLMLGRRVKLVGRRQRIATGPGMVSVHWAPGIAGIVRGMTKNVFAVFRYSAASLAAAVIGIAILCLGPPLLIWVPGVWLPCVIAFLAIVGLYGLSARISRISVAYALGFPIAAVITIYAMLRSMTLTLYRGGIEWRGTFYPLRELRKHDAEMRAKDQAAAGK